MIWRSALRTHRVTELPCGQRWGFAPSVHVTGGAALIIPMRTRSVYEPASVDAKILGGCRGDEN